MNADLAADARYWRSRLGYPWAILTESASRTRVIWQAQTQAEADRRASWAKSIGETVVIAGPEPDDPPTPQEVQEVYDIQPDYQLDIADNLPLRMDDIIGQTQAILGNTGSGKSMSVRRLTEQLLANNLPVAIFDIAGEYHTLRERFPIVVLGKETGDTVDLPLAEPLAASAAEHSIREGQSVILDLSGWPKAAERVAIVTAFLDRLWQVAGELRRPYHLILEEAHHYVPQSRTTDSTDLIIQCATEGRKRGIGIVLASQRSARVDKDVLTQAQLKILHYARYDNDVQTYVANIPSIWMSSAEVKQTAFSMTRGQAMVVTASGVQRVTIKPAATTHVGYTPGVDALTPFQAKMAMDRSLVARFRDALKPADTEADADETAWLRRRIADLERQLRDQTALVEALKETRPAAEPNAPTRVVNITHTVTPEESAQMVQAVQSGLAARMAALVNQPTSTELIDEAVESLVRIDESIAQRQEQARQSALKRQRDKFDLMLYRLQAWTGRGRRRNWRRDFVGLLFKHKQLSKVSAAAMLGITADSFSNRPPLPLVRAGLVTQTGPRTNPVYAWHARERIALEYPSLDIDDLERTLLEKLA